MRLYRLRNGSIVNLEQVVRLPDGRGDWFQARDLSRTPV